MFRLPFSTPSTHDIFFDGRFGFLMNVPETEASSKIFPAYSQYVPIRLMVDPVSSSNNIASHQ